MNFCNFCAAFDKTRPHLLFLDATVRNCELMKILLVIFYIFQKEFVEIILTFIEFWFIIKWKIGDG